VRSSSIHTMFVLAVACSSYERPVGQSKCVQIAVCSVIMLFHLTLDCLAAAGPKATVGDDEFYDSDDYDEDALADSTAKVAVSDTKQKPAGKGKWGKGDDDDDWAPKQQTRPQGTATGGAKEGDGRLLSGEEARALLKHSDEATTRAQGWMRGKDAARRLAAMQSLIAAYPSRQAEREQARNPLQMLTDALWQQRPAQQARFRLLDHSLPVFCLCVHPASLPISGLPC
jgi:hypothetical protein